MFALLLTAAMLHPVHETLAEVEWNEKSKRLEVALRLDALDEQWLRMRAGDPDDLSQSAIDYLRRKFRVTDSEAADEVRDPPTVSEPLKSKQDPTAKYHWIGREDKGPYVWWYFEIEPVDQQRPRWIDVRLLWERNENHVNRILVLGRQPQRAYALTIQRPKVSLGDAGDEQPQPPQPDR